MGSLGLGSMSSLTADPAHLPHPAKRMIDRYVTCHCPGQIRLNDLNGKRAKTN